MFCYKSGRCCQQLCQRKSKQQAACWRIFNERCPHKGVLFDEISTNCGIVNSISIYLRLYFDWVRGWGALTRPICSAPPPQLLQLATGLLLAILSFLFPNQGGGDGEGSNATFSFKYAVTQKPTDTVYLYKLRKIHMNIWRRNEGITAKIEEDAICFLFISVALYNTWVSSAFS